MHEMGRPLRDHAAFSSRPTTWGPSLRRLSWCWGVGLAGLTACASLPPAFAELAWADHQGDRGRGVLERDFVMCSDLVETRRSQLAACMTARGWSLQ